MAQINKPSDYFDIKLWTGNGSTQTISGLSFQPDLVWGKSRNTNYEQSWIDSVRGGTKYLFSNGSGAESTDVNAITAFNSDGYDLGSSPYIGNANTITYVGWNWLAGGTASENTDGSITSQVSANTTSGFSIVSYSGNSTGGATVGHSLGATPSLIIVKDRTTSSYHWQVYHKSLGATKYLQLSLTDAEGTGTNRWNNTEPTSSVFTLGSSLNVNGTGQDYIAYCFAEKKGFSKFGSYTGNGSADGTFVYTGFKPAFFMLKRTDSSSQWVLYDNKRQNNYNPQDERLYPNLNNLPGTGRNVDFLSNGIKLRDSAADSSAYNISGANYIYMAIAEQGLVGTNNIPATAR